MAARPQLRYPCSFPVKVFVKPDSALEDQLIEVVRAQLPPQNDLDVSRHFSRAGRYLCLTFRFTAHSEEQARRVGEALRGQPGVILSL